MNIWQGIRRLVDEFKLFDLRSPGILLFEGIPAVKSAFSCAHTPIYRIEFHRSLNFLFGKYFSEVREEQSCMRKECSSALYIRVWSSYRDASI